MAGHCSSLLALTLSAKRFSAVTVELNGLLSILGAVMFPAGSSNPASDSRQRAGGFFISASGVCRLQLCSSSLNILRTPNAGSSCTRLTTEQT